MALLGIFFLSSCSSTKSGLILNESFDKNERGWIEEKTFFHDVDIRDGYYYIANTDSAADQSSTGARDLSFLFKVPERYEISTSIEQVYKEKPDASFGLLLISATLRYRFEVFSVGIVKISEYNYFSQSYKTLPPKEVSLPAGEPVELTIKIEGNTFDFLVNGSSVTTGNLKAQSWEDLRLFTSSLSTIRVDYLKLK
jgi:hypothetical protein